MSDPDQGARRRLREMQGRGGIACDGEDFRPLDGRALDEALGR